LAVLIRAKRQSNNNNGEKAWRFGLNPGLKKLLNVLRALFSETVVTFMRMAFAYSGGDSRFFWGPVMRATGGRGRKHTAES